MRTEVLVLLAFGLAACGETAPVTTLATADQFGEVRLAIATAPEVARVHLTATAADLDPVEADCAAVDARVSCSLTIRAGLARRFEATAYNQVGTALFSGLATADVPANTVTELIITLQSVEQGAPSGQVNIGANFNKAPRVNWVSVDPNPSRRNRDVDLEVNASDPDGDPLTYQWSATNQSGAAAGTLTNGTSAAAVWRTPNITGDHYVSVTARDNQGGATTSTTRVTVQ